MGRQLEDALKAAGIGSAKPGPKGKSTMRPGGVRAIAQAPRDNSRTHLQTDLPPSWTASDRVGSSTQQNRQPLQGVPRSGSVAIDRSTPATPRAVAPAHEVTDRRPIPPAPSPDFQLVKVGEFQPHHLFQLQLDGQVEVLGQMLQGISSQLSLSPQNETDLIIGLDFGTSATKVVIRDALTGNVFPVVANPGANGLDRFLQASFVILNDGEYVLAGKGERLDDLKLSLLECKAKFPVTEFNRCCAFLALIIRKSRGWLLTKHEAIYRHHQLNWSVNVGLAARSYQDNDKVQLFRRLAWAAANLAADQRFPQITRDAIDQYRDLSRRVFDNHVPKDLPHLEFSVGKVGVVPEVAAQLQGFMTSARWDWKHRPIMMLVDVGAGTVDTALFHVNPTEKRLTFYSSRVEPNGAMNLHRDRVSWLKKGLPNTPDFSVVHDYLGRIARPTGRLQPIPSDVADYLPGYRISNTKLNIDDQFRSGKYRTQVAGSINEAKVNKGIGSNGSQQLKKIPLLLCGGGSRLPTYATIQDEINGTNGWQVSVEKTLMPVPLELKDDGWHLEDFDRISVAYGLSLGLDLEKIVRAIEVPDVRRHVSTESSDRYVSKDQC